MARPLREDAQQQSEASQPRSVVSLARRVPVPEVRRDRGTRPVPAARGQQQQLRPHLALLEPIRRPPRPRRLLPSVDHPRPRRQRPPVHDPDPGRSHFAARGADHAALPHAQLVRLLASRHPRFANSTDALAPRSTLSNRKESRKRNLQFAVPLVVPLSPSVRIVESDASIATLQEVLEDHCESLGLSKEDPILAYTERIRTMHRQEPPLNVSPACFSPSRLITSSSTDMLAAIRDPCGPPGSLRRAQQQDGPGRRAQEGQSEPFSRTVTSTSQADTAQFSLSTSPSQWLRPTISGTCAST